MKSLLAFGLLTLSFATSAQSWKSKIIDDSIILFSPASITAFSKPLQLKIDEGISVGAAANHNFNSLELVVYQGLLDSPKLTPDGLRMIICHEMGHLFGGAPRKNVPPEWEGPMADDGLSFLSSEGQADYYASMVCFRKLTAMASGEEPKPDLKRVGPKLKKKCEVTAGFNGEELKTCLRAGLAGEDFLKVTFDFPISCEKEDTSVSPVLMRDVYPGRQCRLDTIVNGALCNDDKSLILDFMLNEKTSCTKKYALRSKCWFN